MNKVSKEEFDTFLEFYRKNIGALRSQSVTIADRVNYFDVESNLLVAYVNVYRGNTYYIHNSCLTSFASHEIRMSGQKIGEALKSVFKRINK